MQRERVLPRVEDEAEDYLDRAYWSSKISRENSTADVMLANAVNWILRRLYVRGHYTEFGSDIALLQEQRRAIGALDVISARPEEGWISLRRVFIAQSVLDWCATGRMSKDPLAAASDCFDRRMAAHGGLRVAIAAMAESGHWSNVENMLAPEFVRRTLLRDWTWIDMAAELLSQLQGNRASDSSSAMLIRFCKQLVIFSSSPMTVADGEASRQRLGEICWSWTNDFLADRVSDVPIVMPYLCIYSYEELVRSNPPSVVSVRELLAGRTNGAAE